MATLNLLPNDGGSLHVVSVLPKVVQHQGVQLDCNENKLVAEGFTKSLQHIC